MTKDEPRSAANLVGASGGEASASKDLALAATSPPVDQVSLFHESVEQTHSTDLGHADLPPAFDHQDDLPEYRLRDPDRYQIIAEHGRGGLGRVYRARDRELGRDVALKELLHTSHSSEVRFFREALITARLEHPGIVPVHEAGRWPDGTPFYAMKLVAGRPLSELIDKADTTESRLALLPHISAVADAIAYAHDRKIIHRDIKPSNIIVGDYGETIVIDWGLAKELTDQKDAPLSGSPYRTPAAPDVTEAGSILGTPAYMSPEQARGDVADTRSDVYALGAILFQFCTGGTPPASASTASLRAKLRHVQTDLAMIVLKSLSSSPADRYVDARAFATDLRAYELGARIAAREYSLFGLLAHWIKLHKRLTLSIAVPAVIAGALGSAALYQVVLERDRAAHSQRQAEAARALAEKEQLSAQKQRREAERERDRAVRSEAALLLEKDPTRARDVLASQVSPLGPDEALVMARAKGAGVADRVVSLLPDRIYHAVPDNDLKQLAITTQDGKLRVF